MGFRFQKRIKLLPGVTVNLSKSGVSTSVGPRGAKITVGHGKTRTTVGIPGTGLSHTVVSNNARTSSASDTAIHDSYVEQVHYTPPTPQRKPNGGYKFGRWLAKLFKR